VQLALGWKLRAKTRPLAASTSAAVAAVTEGGGAASLDLYVHDPAGAPPPGRPLFPPAPAAGASARPLESHGASVEALCITGRSFRRRSEIEKLCCLK